MWRRSISGPAVWRRAVGTAAHPTRVSIRLAGRDSRASRAIAVTSMREPGKRGRDSVQAVRLTILGWPERPVSMSVHSRCQSATRKTGSPITARRGVSLCTEAPGCTRVRNRAEGMTVVSACCSTDCWLGSGAHGRTANGTVCRASSGTTTMRPSFKCGVSGHSTSRANAWAASRTSAGGASVSRSRSRSCAVARSMSPMNASMPFEPLAYSTSVASSCFKVFTSCARSKGCTGPPSLTAIRSIASINSGWFPWCWTPATSLNSRWYLASGGASTGEAALRVSWLRA